ncbi:MAG TPA: hypothetical protein VMG12_17070 [Polyangiaceae bacterium]|nr:hypothetical protein [Polyangiaceae bacterium]
MSRSVDATCQRHLGASCTRSRRRALLRLRECLLLVSSCLQPQLAHADRVAARSDLGAAPSAAATAPSEAPEALELRIRYRAPRECPSSGNFLDALQRHIAAGGAGGIDADVDIQRASGTEFELSLRLRVAGNVSESSARAESCLELMQLAALNASMARTTSPLGPDVLAATVDDVAASPKLEANAPREVPALGRDAGAEASARESATDGRTRAFVLGEMRTAGGMLPRQAWGPGLSVGVARDIGSLRSSFTSWQGQRSVFTPDQTSPMTLDFEQQSLELAPCAGFALTPALRVDGCVLLGAHRVRTNAESARVSGSIGAGALATLSPWRGLRVELEGSVSAAFARPSFAADAVRYLYEPELLQPGARIALGWEFGGGT